MPAGASRNAPPLHNGGSGGGSGSGSRGQAAPGGQLWLPLPVRPAAPRGEPLVPAAQVARLPPVSHGSRWDGRISRAGPWWLRHRRGCQGLCRPKETGTGRGRWLGGDLPSGVTECAAAWLGSRGRPSQNGSLAAQRPRYRGQSELDAQNKHRQGRLSKCRGVFLFILFYCIYFQR